MNLPVVPASLLLEEEFAESFGTEIAGDAESICTMRLGNAVPDPYVDNRKCCSLPAQDATPLGGSKPPSA